MNLILLFDAVGLGLFAVTGTQKALGYGLSPIMAPLLGMMSGIGGGMLRDILVAEIPTVLRSDLYAVAALAGAVCVSCRDGACAPATITTPSHMSTAPASVARGPGVRPSTDLRATLSLPKDRCKRPMSPPSTSSGRTEAADGIR